MLGAYTMLLQILVLRQCFCLFSGNELSLAVQLGLWLCFTSIGGAVGTLLHEKLTPWLYGLLAPAGLGAVTSVRIMPILANVPIGIEIGLGLAVGNNEGYAARIVRECEDIVICKYGAWTATGDGNVKGWSVIDSKGNNVTSSVTITWHPRAGLSGEIHITPDGGTWADILNDDRETLLLVFRDKGNAAGSYYHPLLQRWIHLVAGKSVCDQKSLVECDVCPPAVVFAFDDASTPDTIAPGGTITLNMTGGKGPFAWSTSSTGYTFGKTSTAFQNNTLISASGVCGVAYDPVADVIITDACGDAIAIEIRNTGGQWILIDSRGSYHGPPQFDEECIIGKIKWFDDMCCISPNTCNEGPFVRHCFIQTGCAGGPATEHWKKYEWQC